MRLREEDRGRVEDINDILLSTPQGQVVAGEEPDDACATRPGRPRSSARTRSGSSASPPSREATLSDAVAAVNARLAEVSRAARTSRVGFGAEVEEQARAFSQLQMMLILAILLVYAVMASQYESLRDPFIIMFSVPLAAIGVVLALKLTGTTFSLQAYIGVIMLAGHRRK